VVVTPRERSAFLAAFVPADRGVHTLLPRDAADTLLLARDARDLDSGSVAAAVRALPAAPSEATLLNLATHVSRPTLGAWRAVAHGGLLPLFWPYRENADDLESPSSGAFSTTDDRMTEIATANLFEGIAALAKKDYATGELRARENLAVIRQLVRGGTMSFGAPEQVTRDAAAALDWIGRAEGRGDLVMEAVELRDAAPRQPTVHPAAGALFADPAFFPIAQTIADTNLAPAVRVRLAEYTATGFCSNPHEVMFGVDPARLALLGVARANLADLPGSQKLLTPWERWLSDAVRTGITRPVVSRTPTTGPIARPIAVATSLFRLTGLRSRLAYCGLS
jgi:hypothetical protein